MAMVGCAQQQQQESFQLANLLYSQEPQTVLKQLQKSEPSERSSAQFHLNIGMVYLLSGHFHDAIDILTLAKREMAVLEAASVSENFAAATISETLRNYSGYPTDKVMVHTMLAFSYLFNNDIDGARVEVLQADVAMKKLANRQELLGQLASAHLLSAVIYEMLDEQSNALISYKFAADIIKQRGYALPLGLKKSLLRMSFKIGDQAQYNQYRKQFANLALPTENSKSRIFAFYFDGIVSHKIQKSLMVPVDDGEQVIRISVPSYPVKNYPLKRANLVLKEQQANTELVEDVEGIVRDDLSDDYPSILLMTTARALSKYKLVDTSNDVEPLLGLIVNMATLLTEIADLRSWNTLPSNIQFTYLETNENGVSVQNNGDAIKVVPIEKGSQNILLINGLSNSVFHYQQ